MTATPDDNAAQIAYWNEQAAGNWTALQEQLDDAFAPLTVAALDRAAVTPGEQILDVGCGCGATVLELARRTGSSGHVLGLDVSRPMAARARDRIAAAGLAHADILVADAAAHRFPAAGTDLLFSRFGVMFFADPAGAFAHLRRAMRPGGRLLFAAWRPQAENPFFTVAMDAIRHLLPPQPPADPRLPGPFAFADPARVQAILGEAGWRGIAVNPADARMPLGARGEASRVAAFLTRVGPVARALADTPELRPQIEPLVTEAIRRLETNDGIALTAAIWLVSARA